MTAKPKAEVVASKGEPSHVLYEIFAYNDGEWEYVDELTSLAEAKRSMRSFCDGPAHIVKITLPAIGEK